MLVNYINIEVGYIYTHSWYYSCKKNHHSAFEDKDPKMNIFDSLGENVIRMSLFFASPDSGSVSN